MAYKEEGKAPLQKIDPEFVEEMSRVQALGDQKHVDHHWLDGVSVSEILGAIKRHVASIEKGDFLDAETGYSHAAHAACGLMYIAHYGRNYGRYAQFFDLLYQRPAEAGRGVGGPRISHAESEWLLNQALRGNSGAFCGPERGGTSGRTAPNTGSIPLDGDRPGEGTGQENENQ